MREFFLNKLNKIKITTKKYHRFKISFGCRKPLFLTSLSECETEPNCCVKMHLARLS